MTDMLTIIENCEPDEAQMRLVMRGTYEHTIFILDIRNYVYHSVGDNVFISFFFSCHLISRLLNNSSILFFVLLICTSRISLIPLTFTYLPSSLGLSSFYRSSFFSHPKSSASLPILILTLLIPYPIFIFSFSPFLSFPFVNFRAANVC